jgi:hypothetical protein
MKVALKVWARLPLVGIESQAGKQKAEDQL